MSTKTLLDEIMPYASGYSREGVRSVLSLIQKGQDELFDCEEAGVHYIRGDINIGFPPYLITTDGVQEYDITAANLSGVTSLTWKIGGTEYAIRAKRLLDIFVDSTNPDYGYGRRFVGRPYTYAYPNPYTNAWTRLEVSPINVDSRPALETTPARVVFPENPLAKTETYFALFTIEPPRLLSQSIPLMVPTYFEEGIKDFTMGTIQRDANGTWNDRLGRFYIDNPLKGEVSWKERFRAEMRKGAQVNDSFTPTRLC